MNDIIEKQKEFQKLVDFPIESLQESDRNELSEIYLFKLIEEVVELRKEIPSVMNKWAKTVGEAKKTRILNELSDVILFLVNFCITWRLEPDEVLQAIREVQVNNFVKVKEKKMALLNEEMLGLPGYTIGIGQGNLMPKYIFIGQNPGANINHGYKVWSNPEDGASQMLLPALGHDIIEQSYFTNLVKCITKDNQEPDYNTTQFWLGYLDRELEILMAGNPDVKVVTMGNFAYDNLGLESIKIKHPSYHMRQGTPVEKYSDEIKRAIAYNN